MIVILKDYGKVCLCVLKTDELDHPEYFTASKFFAERVADLTKEEFVDLSEEINEQKLLEHNKVLIIKP